MDFLRHLLIFLLWCCKADSWNSWLGFSQRLSRDSLKIGFLSGILSATIALSPCNANEFVAPDSSFSFQYPQEFQISEKILGITVKTHEYEVLLKSQKTKGFTAGLTVDGVRLNDIKEFSSPEALGKRVIDVEIKKDDDWYMSDPLTMKRDLRRTRLLSAEEMMNPFSYVLDYQLDSSRGFKRNLVRSIVDKKKLYIFTVQCDQDLYESDPSIRDTAKNLINSFRLKSAEN